MSTMEVELIAPNGRIYKQPTGLFINNEWVDSLEGGRISSINPTNEAEICSVSAASAADVDLAVHAARTAFPSWRIVPPAQRGDLLLCLSRLIDEHAETLATIESWDNGKPYSVALADDLPEASATLKYYAGWADKIHGDTIDAGPSKLAYTLREPIGVCGQIIPWNYPLTMAAWKLAPALACGNTVVLKAAEQTPLSILYLAKLVREAGFPPGVVNILNGSGVTAGHALAAHSGVDKIAFTGSSAVGREVMRAASATMKRITLETGGKSPLLVFADADLEQAVRWAYVGAMSNMGQVCSATSRILVQASVSDVFADLFTTHVRNHSIVGDPFAAATTHGPLISRAQHDRVLSYIASGTSAGATLSLGGLTRPTTAPAHGKGFFVAPTVFTAATPAMAISRDEIFGPVAALASFTSEADAVRLANASAYGLAAAVFTRDGARALRVAAALEAGSVWINSCGDGDVRVPFGGVKQSGVGSELGEEGLAAYTNVKAVHVNLGKAL